MTLEINYIYITAILALAGGIFWFGKWVGELNEGISFLGTRMDDLGKRMNNMQSDIKLIFHKLSSSIKPIKKDEKQSEKETKPEMIELKTFVKNAKKARVVLRKARDKGSVKGLNRGRWQWEKSSKELKMIKEEILHEHLIDA